MFSRWRSRLKTTLGLRLAVWYAGVFTISTALLIVGAYALLANSLQQRDHEIVVSTLREYAGEYSRGGLRALAAALERGQRAGLHERLFVRVVTTRGETVFASLPAEWGRFDTEALSFPDQPADSVWGAVTSAERGSVLEVASLRLRDGTRVQVGKSTESRDELLRRVRSLLGGSAVFVLLLGLVGGVVVTRSTLRPAHRLASAVRSIIATGRTDVRVQIEASGDPLDDLGSLFNAMLERITRLVDGMRNSLDNVAHDLRTPLARLRARAEEALTTTGADTRDEVLADCIAEADRIAETLDALMDIAEAQSGALRLIFAPIAVRHLLDEVVELYVDAAEAKQVRLTVEAAPDLTVPGDVARVRQAIANLVDNGIKYSPPGHAVHLFAERRGSEVAIVVRDSGTGIDPSDIPRIWDRLYRGDRSRSSRGLGLGLSLVKAFVEAHGGSVAVESELGVGSTFTILLPTIAPPAIGNSANLSEL